MPVWSCQAHPDEFEFFWAGTAQCECVNKADSIQKCAVWLFIDCLKLAAFCPAFNNPAPRIVVVHTPVNRLECVVSWNDSAIFEVKADPVSCHLIWMEIVVCIAVSQNVAWLVVCITINHRGGGDANQVSNLALRSEVTENSSEFVISCVFKKWATIFYRMFSASVSHHITVDSLAPTFNLLIQTLRDPQPSSSNHVACAEKRREVSNHFRWPMHKENSFIQNWIIIFFF